MLKFKILTNQNFSCHLSWGSYDWHPSQHRLLHSGPPLRGTCNKKSVISLTPQSQCLHRSTYSRPVTEKGYLNKIRHRRAHSCKLGCNIRKLEILHVPSFRACAVDWISVVHEQMFSPVVKMYLFSHWSRTNLIWRKKVTILSYIFVPFRGSRLRTAVCDGESQVSSCQFRAVDGKPFSASTCQSAAKLGHSPDRPSTLELCPVFLRGGNEGGCFTDEKNGTHLINY
jgi:hypothetical protein